MNLIERDTPVNRMNKMYNDQGEVAILYSPGFGAGWSTWGTEYGEELVFDPGLVSIAMSDDEDRLEKMQSYATLKWPNKYLGGLEDLQVMWIPEGTMFRIEEYDGSESVQLQENTEWMIA